MPGLSFVFVGRMKEPHFEAAFAEYMKRLGGFCKIHVFTDFQKCINTKIQHKNASFS